MKYYSKFEEGERTLSEQVTEEIYINLHCCQYFTSQSIENLAEKNIEQTNQQSMFWLQDGRSLKGDNCAIHLTCKVLKCLSLMAMSHA